MINNANNLKYYLDSIVPQKVGSQTRTSKKSTQSIHPTHTETEVVPAYSTAGRLLIVGQR